MNCYEWGTFIAARPVSLSAVSFRWLRSASVSEFMKTFKQRFTQWYNRENSRRDTASSTLWLTVPYPVLLQRPATDPLRQSMPAPVWPPQGPCRGSLPARSAGDALEPDRVAPKALAEALPPRPGRLAPFRDIRNALRNNRSKHVVCPSACESSEIDSNLEKPRPLRTVTGGIRARIPRIQTLFLR